ncbi:MAG: hypothetical protein C3F15_13875 [Holophagae bacterium]|nr:MAG: hypothetical protein C3F15_13875 [Holophagae bacterium]
MVGGVSGIAVTVNPPGMEKVSVPCGVGKVTAQFFAPVGSDDGMLNTAVTLCWLEWEAEVPTSVPIVTLLGSTPDGGAGGLSVSRVKVTSRPLVPCSAELGSTAVIWLVL